MNSGPLNVLYSGCSELREIPTRQVRGEPLRRWFMSANCDLIVWIRPDESLEGFQFCYDKDEREHALTWTETRGYDYRAVETGEFTRGHFGSVISLATSPFDRTRVLGVFESESRSVPPEYAELVRRQIASYLA